MIAPLGGLLGGGGITQHIGMPKSPKDHKSLCTNSTNQIHQKPKSKKKKKQKKNGRRNILALKGLSEEGKEKKINLRKRNQR
jgi:hypothetical protein